MILWLRLHASTTGGTGLTLAGELEIPHTKHQGKKTNKKNNPQNYNKAPRIKQFNKAVRHNFNMKKSILFLYPGNELETET